MHKRLSLCALIVLVVLGHAAPVFAGLGYQYPPTPTPPPPPTTKKSGGQFDIKRDWGYGNPGAPHVKGGPAATNCTAKDGTYGKATAHPYTGTNHPPTPSGPGEWYQTFCAGHAGWVWWRGPAGVPAANEQALLNQLAPVPPDIHLNPTGQQVVNLRSFMWVAPIAVTTPAVAADGSSITITATPGDVLWDAGDGSPWWWCHSDGGAAYDPSKSDDAQSACSHTYARSSAAAGPQHEFTLTAHEQWTGTWTGTGGAAGGGSLGTIETSSSVPVSVAEIQALNTSH
jgi:hypothetical protein